VAELGKTARLLSWAGQLIAAGILAQTLFFKFSGSAESVYSFSIVGIEPWGRIATGVVELIVVLLLLYPRTAGIGAGVALGLMVGAIGLHLTRLGIEVQGDKGLLFKLALAVTLCALTVLVIRRRELPVVGGWFD
jgi:hypothetical protein